MDAEANGMRTSNCTHAGLAEWAQNLIKLVPELAIRCTRSPAPAPVVRGCPTVPEAHGGGTLLPDNEHRE